LEPRNHEKYEAPCLTVHEALMGLPDTIMDHFCGVRPISLAAVFRRRLRHGCYTMTTITTARVHRTVTSHGPRNAWNQFPCVPTYVNHCL